MLNNQQWSLALGKWLFVPGLKSSEAYWMAIGNQDSNPRMCPKELSPIANTETVDWKVPGALASLLRPFQEAPQPTLGSSSILSWSQPEQKMPGKPEKWGCLRIVDPASWGPALSLTKMEITMALSRSRGTQSCCPSHFGSESAQSMERLLMLGRISAPSELLPQSLGSWFHSSSELDWLLSLGRALANAWLHFWLIQLQPYASRRWGTRAPQEKMLPVTTSYILLSPKPLGTNKLQRGVLNT